MERRLLGEVAKNRCERDHDRKVQPEDPLRGPSQVVRRESERDERQQGADRLPEDDRLEGVDRAHRILGRGLIRPGAGRCESEERRALRRYGRGYVAER